VPSLIDARNRSASAPNAHVEEVAARLASQNLVPDRQVLQLDDDTWLIHGSIAYAGEVIAAVFSTLDDAWAVIALRRDG
jgi:hypothetical protein